MNPILKLVQQVKDAEGVTLASVIKKVEDIRIGENQNKNDLKKLAVALVALKKQVDSIPLTEEVKKLQRAILDAEERVSGALSARIDSVEKDLRATEERLLAEIDIKIPDIVTVTEKVTEVAKELTEEEQNKIMARIFSEEGAKQVRDMLEGLEGDDRLDAKAIKNLPDSFITNAGGGSNLSVFSNGTFVSSSTRLNFVGATVTDEGGRTKVTITGGSGSSTFLDLTDTPSSYSGQAGKAVVVNGTADGLEFVPLSGGGDMLASVYDPANGARQVAFDDSVVKLTGDQTASGVKTFSGRVQTPTLRATSSAGLTVQSNSGTQVVDFGAGGGSNATFAGGVNIDGATRLATSLTGPLRADSGVVSVGTDNAGITRSVVVTSGSVTAGNTALTDYVYMVAGAHTISLPAASGNTNLYTIKNNHSANITVDTVGTETIDGTASISLAPEESVQIISNGTNYFIV